MKGPTAASETKAGLTEAQRFEWLRLIRSENVGPRTFRSLINHFGGAGAALEALPDVARRRTGRPIRIASAEDCEREWEGMKRLGARFIALGDPEYPQALRMIDAPPPLLAVRGRLDALARSMVAIVGSRNASANGLAFAERLAREISTAGHIVASGLARGIDARAHRASIDKGTVAVLAGGLARIYPSEHRGLTEEILENGAVLSEMPLEWEPRGRDFPRRNRIVSGLSLAIVIVEASERSGSLITARFALEQGREVFAVPGSPLDPRSAGANSLLKQGANLCVSASDVLEALEPLLRDGVTSRTDLREDERLQETEPLWEESDLFGDLPVPKTSPGFDLNEQQLPPLTSAAERRFSDEEVRSRIFSVLGPAPALLDDVIRASECPAAQVRTAMLELELEGRLERQPGDRVALIFGK